MTSLRHRVPFRAVDDDDGNPAAVLDDQEQEELVAELNAANARSSARAVLVLDTVLVLSALLHIVSLFTGENPLLAFFPSPAPEPPPCPTAFTLLALALHASLAVHLHPQPRLRGPLPYALTYALAAVAPAVALVLGCAWQTTAWAAVPALVVALTHSVHATLREGDAALAELESLKYRAPGP
ncbi:hypothetical protein B0H15DRAFT_74708 [Mycena belliarum]|uniref:Uncharacterized protein n=1 Tax=Mycena belliarum TaxID=1033014 RepID=A0AAD6UAN3_9AGAR|nr:hypothetical protein B0H15DRAFT_74708 [Mycena belliae]